MPIFFDNLSYIEQLVLIISTSSLLVAMIYYLFLFLPVVNYKLSKQPQIREGIQPLSIVVIIKDNIDFLENEVSKLMSQEYEGEYELVIVDNRSNLDQTEELLSKLEARYDNLYVTKIAPSRNNAPSNKKLAYTIGVKGAKYENVLFISPKVTIDSEKLVEIAAKGFKYGNIVTAYRRIEVAKGFVNVAARARNITKSLLYMGKIVKNSTYMTTNQIFGFTRTMFFKHNGFSSYLRLNGGENDLFIQSIARREAVALLLNPKITVEGRSPESIASHLKDEAFLNYSRRFYPLTTKLYLAIYYIANLLFWGTTTAAMILTSSKIILFSLLGLMLFKLAIILIIASRIGKRTREKVPYLYMIVYDLIAPFEELSLIFRNRFKPRKDIWV